MDTITYDTKNDSVSITPAVAPVVYTRDEIAAKIADYQSAIDGIDADIASLQERRSGAVTNRDDWQSKLDGLDAAKAAAA